MRLVPSTSHDCDAVREQLSRALDETLSEHERIRLESHLEDCADCRRFRAEARVVVHTLRETPLEQPTFPVVLPHRRRIPVRALQAGVAAAAVAIVAGLSGVHALSGSHRSVTSLRVPSHAFLDRKDEVVPARFRQPQKPVGAAARIPL